MKSLRV